MEVMLVVALLILFAYLLGSVSGSLTLGRSGAFGYTVRVVPRHDLLASPAELGVIALPA